MSGNEVESTGETENGSVTELSPEQQRQVMIGITLEDEPQVKEGDNYYLLSFR